MMHPTSSSSRGRSTGREALEQIARKYQEEGFEVVLEPVGGDLPPFLVDFRPDLVARRGGEGVVVEIARKRLDLADKPRLSDLAERVQDEPGWRMDVVVLERGTSADRAIRSGVEPADEQIGPMIEVAENMATLGFLPSAYVAAVGSLEAVMRNICQDAELYPNRTFMDCLHSIYTHDLVSRSQFIALRDAFKVRGQIVHGLIPPPLDIESVEFVTKTAKSLLYGVEQAGPPPESR